MRRFKKMLIALLCVSVFCGVTACGNNKDTADNNAATEGTDNNSAADKNTENGNTTGDDAAKGSATENGNNGEGVVDQIGDDVRDGVDDMADNLDGTKTDDGTRTDDGTKTDDRTGNDKNNK